MIKVYQIKLSDMDYSLINSVGFEANDKTRAYGRMSFVKPEEVDMSFYTHVANVLTYDREDAFTLMNLWEQPELIQLVDGPCRSMSVGDVVEMDNGDRYLCASFGFKQI
jgi:hypothetical protein